MKLLIEIPSEWPEWINLGCFGIREPQGFYKLCGAVLNGKPITEKYDGEMELEEAKDILKDICVMCPYGSKDVNSCDIFYCDKREAVQRILAEVDKQFEQT